MGIPQAPQRRGSVPAPGCKQINAASSAVDSCTSRAMLSSEASLLAVGAVPPPETGGTSALRLGCCELFTLTGENSRSQELRIGLSQIVTRARARPLRPGRAKDRSKLQEL